MDNGTITIEPVDRRFYHRFIVKFDDHFIHSDVRNVNDCLENDDQLWNLILVQFPGLQVNKLFTSLSREKIIELVRKGRLSDPSYQPPDLHKYYVVTCAPEINPNELINGLLRFEWVEHAYMQGKQTNPAINIQSESVYAAQDYFNPAPAGIDIKYAWQLKGGRGNKRIQFIDIEQGWTLDEERFDAGILPLTGINVNAYRQHGAAVLEVVMGKLNGNGLCGIVPEAVGYVMSQWRPDGSPNDADAILAAISYLNYGDIILLESQSFHSSTQNKLWPAEIQEATYQVIRLAAALGIIVIEAAGNGDLYSGTGNDLDLFKDNGKAILSPGNLGFRDSGAILVAACDALRTRMRGSNYGNRINCYASGRPSEKLNGTSGAAAIIAGVTIAIQSIAETIHDMRLSPAQMRSIFSDESYGTSSANGHAHDKIGVMPDVKKITEHYLKIQMPSSPGIS